MTEPRPPAGDDDRGTSDSARRFIGEWIGTLKQQRDELALKIHLAEMDAKKEFEKAQKKLEKLSNDYEPTREAVAESAESIWESLKLVADEVKTSFDRIRKTM